MAYIVYNDGITTDGVSTFTRDVATRDQQGVNRAIDKRRFGKNVSVAPLVTWISSGVAGGSGGTPDPLGTGWDHDGVTPILVIKDASSQIHRIFRGLVPVEVNTFPFSDVMDGTVANTQYQADACVVFHGLIILLCDRHEDPGSGYRSVGVSIITSDDLGATWTILHDVPSNVAAAGFDEGLNKVSRWAMSNAFPTNGLTDVLTARIPWVDYIGRNTKSTDIDNGDFDDSSAWTFNGGWAHNTDVATHTTGALSNLTQLPNTALVEDVAYMVTFDVIGRTAGTVRPVIGGGQGTLVSTNGTAINQYIKAGAAVNVIFQASSDFDGDIDNVVFDVSDSKGGQCGAFEISRTGVGETWTIGTNRLLHEEWFDAHPIHWHSMAPTTSGWFIHQGDASYKNRMTFLPFDFDDFDGATVGTPVEVFGRISEDDSIQRIAAQSVNLAPTPILGEHFGVGDVHEDIISRYGPMSSSGDQLTITSPLRRWQREKLGSLWDGHESFQLTYQTDTGWTVGGFDSLGKPNAWVSIDGDNWAEIRMVDEASSQFLFFYGNKLMMINDNTQEIMLADIPTIERVKPLQINRGGINILGGNLAEKSSPASPNTVTQVTYDGTSFITGGIPISPQPNELPPFVDGASMILTEVPSGSTVRGMGHRWLYPSADADWTASPNYVLHGWICNLSEVQGAWWHGSLRAAPGGVQEDVDAGIHSYRTNETREWSPVAWWGGVTGTGVGRDWLVPTDGASQPSPFSRVLLVAEGMNTGEIPTYSLAEGVTGSHELEEYSGAVCEQAWSMHLTAQWPVNAPMASSGSFVLATAYQSDNDYVDIRWQPEDVTSGNITAQFVDTGGVIDTLSVSCDLFTSQIFDIILTRGTGDFTLTARNAGIDVYSDTGTVVGDAPNIKPTAVRWSNSDQTEVSQICPIMVNFNESEAWDSTEILAELALTLSERIPTGVVTHVVDGNVNILSQYSQFDSDDSGVLENSDFGQFSYNLFYPTGIGLGEVANVYHDSISIDSDAVEVINVQSVTFNPVNVSFFRGMSRIKSFTLHNKSGTGDLHVDFSDTSSSTVFKDMFGSPTGSIAFPPNSYYHINDGMGAGYVVDINNNNLVISGGDSLGVMDVVIMGDS